MSKKTVKSSKNNGIKESVYEGKTYDEIREIIQVLQAQLQQSRTQAIRIEGALEVMLQMLPKEVASEG